MSTSHFDSKPFEGFSFLVIEDDGLQALSLCVWLTRLGGRIANVARNYNHARVIAEDTDFDCAILDANLHGKMSFPVASIMKKRGIPFIFWRPTRTWFHEGIDNNEAPILAKPCSEAVLQKTLMDIVNSRSLGPLGGS